MSQFRYFPSFPEGATLTEEVCGYCGVSPAISEAWLSDAGSDDTKKPACAECLREGRATTRVPSWLERDLARGVDATHPNWTAEKRAALVRHRVAELGHTPPVPWLQNNEWPICGDDFALFEGELTSDLLVRRHRGLNQAKAALRAIIKEAVPAWDLDEEAVDTAWKQLGNFVAIFVFRCPEANSPIYVLQTA